MTDSSDDFFVNLTVLLLPSSNGPLMSLLKFLPGILVVQAATAALLVNAMGSSLEAHWLAMAILVILVTLLATLWFGSIAEHVKKDALAEAAIEFAREREKILMTAETSKRVALEESHQRIVHETRKVHSRANLKLGLGLFGLFSLGALMLVIEFMTVGLFVLSTAGGVLAGYILRARQDALVARRKTAVVELRPSSRQLGHANGSQENEGHGKR
jgi:membrane protein implicated in regulation of membrane protease activity